MILIISFHFFPLPLARYSCFKFRKFSFLYSKSSWKNIYLIFIKFVTFQQAQLQYCNSCLFSRAGRSQGLLHRHFRHQFFKWLTGWSFVKISLQSRYALINRDGAFSHKIDYVRKFFKILNLEGHPNCTTGIFKEILLNWWNFSIGWVA